MRCGKVVIWKGVPITKYPLWLWKTRLFPKIGTVIHENFEEVGVDSYMDQAVWKSVLGEIEVSVSHATFMTWFKNTELLEQSDESITIAVPNIFDKRQFEVKFNDQVRSVLKNNGVTPKHIE